MKRVLIAGPRFFGYSKSVADAFEQAKFRVTLLEWTENGIENLGEKIRYNLAKDKEKFFAGKELAFNRKLTEAYDQCKPDMVFVIRGSVINRQSLQHMQQSVLVLWMMDSIFLVEKTYTNVGLYNHVFLFEKEDIQLLKERCGIDAHFLPLALDRSVYYPVKNEEKVVDILFVGALYEDRIRLLKKIIERFPGKRIKIYGVYFSKLRNLKRYLFRDDKKYFTNKTLTPAELNIKYSQAKICINMHHSQSVYGVNQRFFELSGAMALQICDKRGFIEDNFTADEVLLYDSEEQLLQMIAQVLPAVDSYGVMKQKVYEKVTSRHTFFCRVQKVLEVCRMKA